MLHLDMIALTAAINKNAHTPAAPWEYAEIVLESADYLSFHPVYTYTVTIKSELPGHASNGLVYKVFVEPDGIGCVQFKRFARIKEKR